MFNWKDKRVLVTGSEGCIGRELVELLERLGTTVFKIDIKRFWNRSSDDCLECGEQHTAIPMDIRDYSLMKDIMNYVNPEYIFHLFGIKGSPKMTNERPADFMLPMLQGDVNMIRLAQEF